MKITPVKKNTSHHNVQAWRELTFTEGELEAAERLLKHIDQFQSPQKEAELVRFIISQYPENMRKAA